MASGRLSVTASGFKGQVKRSDGVEDKTPDVLIFVGRPTIFKLPRVYVRGPDDSLIEKEPGVPIKTIEEAEKLDFPIPEAFFEVLEKHGSNLNDNAIDYDDDL